MRIISFFLSFLLLTSAWSHSHHHNHGENRYRDTPQVSTHPSVQVHVPRQCINGPFGGQVCGFNCIRSIHNAACGNTPDQYCVADNFGHIACGYGCVKSPFKVACASRPWQNCIMNQFNELRCGRNCRVDGFGHIACD